MLQQNYSMICYFENTKNRFGPKHLATQLLNRFVIMKFTVTIEISRFFFNFYSLIDGVVYDIILGRIHFVYAPMVVKGKRCCFGIKRNRILNKCCHWIAINHTIFLLTNYTAWNDFRFWQHQSYSYRLPP